MTTSDYIKGQVALACWRAAQDELPSVMLSVGMVFKNRTEAGWYDGDIYQNVTKWLEENPGDFPDTRDPKFQQLLAKIDLVTTGMAKDTTDGALWFCPKTQLPEKIGGVITATLGQMVFIK